MLRRLETRDGMERGSPGLRRAEISRRRTRKGVWDCNQAGVKGFCGLVLKDRAWYILIQRHLSLECGWRYGSQTRYIKKRVLIQRKKGNILAPKSHWQLHRYCQWIARKGNTTGKRNRQWRWGGWKRGMVRKEACRNIMKEDQGRGMRLRRSRCKMIVCPCIEGPGLWYIVIQRHLSLVCGWVYG